MKNLKLDIKNIKEFNISKNEGDDIQVTDNYQNELGNIDINDIKVISLKLNSGVDCVYSRSDKHFGALFYNDDYSAESYLELRSVTLSDIGFNDGTVSLDFDCVDTDAGNLDVRVCNDDITLI